MHSIGRGNLPSKSGGPFKSQSHGPSPLKSFPRKQDASISNSRLNNLEDIYRQENLSQNLNQVVSKYDVASRQVKDLVEILRKLNGSKP